MLFFDDSISRSIDSITSLTRLTVTNMCPFSVNCRIQKHQLLASKQKPIVKYTGFNFLLIIIFTWFKIFQQSLCVPTPKFRTSVEMEQFPLHLDNLFLIFSSMHEKKTKLLNDMGHQSENVAKLKSSSLIIGNS